MTKKQNYEGLNYEKLDLDETKYKDIIENTSDWIWEVDHEGKYTYSSPQVDKMLGYKNKDIIGNTPFEFMPPYEANRVSKIFDRYVSLKKPFENLENINLHKNGSLVVMETSGTPIFDTDGKFLGYRGIDRDITKRKRAEEKLIESEQKYRALVNNIPGMVYMGFYDWSAEFLSGCRTVTGYSRSELNAKENGWLSLIHPDDVEDVFEQGSQLAKQPKEITHAYKIIDKSGDVRWVEDRKQSLFSKKGDFIGISGVVFDITKRKQSEAKLEEYSSKLEEIVENRTQELEIKSMKLSEINTALKVILKSREKDKNVLEEQIISNVKNLVFPYVKKLRNTVQKETEKSIIRTLESNLKDILSTFSLALSSEGYGLTSTEMLIADLIRNGKRTKKIAEMNNISQKTVEVHRNNIRRKLGINGKKVNLQTYLRSINN